MLQFLTETEIHGLLPVAAPALQSWYGVPDIQYYLAVEKLTSGTCSDNMWDEYELVLHRGQIWNLTTGMHSTFPLPVYSFLTAGLMLVFILADGSVGVCYHYDDYYLPIALTGRAISIRDNNPNSPNLPLGIQTEGGVETSHEICSTYWQLNKIPTAWEPGRYAPVSGRS